MNKGEQLANEHWDWQETLLREFFEAWLKITEKLVKDNCIHGYKHRGEDESTCSLRIQPDSYPGIQR